MRFPRMLDRARELLILLAACGPTTVSANLGRRDMCGISMFTSDLHDVGSFTAIEATLTVPSIAEDPGQAQYLTSGVALCCGNDCSTSLFAGILVNTASAAKELNHTYTAEPVFHLAPHFTTIVMPDELQFSLNASSILWTRIEILPTAATLTFTRLDSPTRNFTATVIFALGENQDGSPLMKVSFEGNRAKASNPYATRDNYMGPVHMCGDSAWWFVSDNFDPGEDAHRPDPLARFSPALIGNHRVETDRGTSFPADLSVGGIGRYWNMVRTIDGRNKTLCEPRMLADSGMTVLHAPHDWGV